MEVQMALMKAWHRQQSLLAQLPQTKNDAIQNSGGVSVPNVPQVAKRRPKESKRI